jgi:hypothetical protein
LGPGKLGRLAAQAPPWGGANVTLVGNGAAVRSGPSDIVVE